MGTFMCFCGRENGATIVKNIFAVLREIECAYIVRPCKCTVKCLIQVHKVTHLSTLRQHYLEQYSGESKLEINKQKNKV